MSKSPSTPVIKSEAPHNASARPRTRDAVIALLGPDDAVRVQAAEAKANVGAGENYLDLHHLDHGVRCPAADATAITNVVPKSAVSDRLWQFLLAQTPQQQHAEALAAKLEQSALLSNAGSAKAAT